MRTDMIPHLSTEATEAETKYLLYNFHLCALHMDSENILTETDILLSFPMRAVHIQKTQRLGFGRYGEEK